MSLSCRFMCGCKSVRLGSLFPMLWKREFSTQDRKEPPIRPTVYSWHKNFVQTVCTVRHAKSPVAQVFLDATVEHLRESFIEVYESQRDVRLRKLVFRMLLCGECYENVPQHASPRSANSYSGADSRVTSFPRSHTPGYFLMEIL
jgi:hypothetical protein